jgi:hypothetical protein
MQIKTFILKVIQIGNKYIIWPAHKWYLKFTILVCLFLGSKFDFCISFFAIKMFDNIHYFLSYFNHIFIFNFGLLKFIFQKHISIYIPVSQMLKLPVCEETVR